MTSNGHATVHLKPHTVNLMAEAVRAGVNPEATFGSRLSLETASAMRRHESTGTPIDASATTTSSASTSPTKVSHSAANQINSAVRAGVDVDRVIQQSLGDEISRAMIRGV